MSVLVLLGLSIITFALARVVPSDPAALYVGPRARPEQVAEMTIKLGLDKPLYVQYLYYLRDALHGDLGILMNRHSTVTSYLELILMAVCGRIGVPGGNIIPGTIMALGSHSDERNPKTWRTVTTDFPAIMGYFPPNVMPEEILADAPDRLRAVLVSGANPLRSYADTTAYEKAFAALDLLVTFEVAMSETAALSHYVLPVRSGFGDGGGAGRPSDRPVAGQPAPGCRPERVFHGRSPSSHCDCCPWSVRRQNLSM